MKKILIANRGEIALRVIRTCKEMGISTVAVYSDADRKARFVKEADESHALGGVLASESYLVHDKIIDACKSLGVDGIHPGYGFLSENAEFRRRVDKEGITFIGPGPEAMELMGSKLAAKDFAKKYDIPMVPGTDYAITDTEEAKKIAAGIGYPVLIKASAGGGGKGMRVVEKEEELAEQMNRAISEAKSAFGDGAVFIERYVTTPKHIEIQVLTDQHGNGVYVFERECTIQRRHQKVIEEAPSPVISPELRKEMGECAVKIAQNCNYEGAGTVEFLYDDGNYYFLEMNTRLQVEHPVSEMISGLDLVREQINVARGEKLSFTQDDLKINGHSIEVRVYAENVEEGFLPDTGTLKVYEAPQGPGVRVDDGFEEGDEIPVYYDPMISKLIVHANTRELAIERMIRAIDEYRVVGVKTTLQFCKYILKTDAFKSGHFSTNYVKEEMPDLNVIRESNPDEAEIAALAAIQLLSDQKKADHSVVASGSASSWKKNRSLKY